MTCRGLWLTFWHVDIYGRRMVHVYLLHFERNYFTGVNRLTTQTKLLHTYKNEVKVIPSLPAQSWKSSISTRCFTPRWDWLLPTSRSSVKEITTTYSKMQCRSNLFSSALPKLLYRASSRKNVKIAGFLALKRQIFNISAKSNGWKPCVDPLFPQTGRFVMVEMRARWLKLCWVVVTWSKNTSYQGKRRRKSIRTISDAAGMNEKTDIQREISKRI